MDEDFSFIRPLDLITKDVYELRQMINEKKKSQQKDIDKVFDRENEREPRGVTEREKQYKGKEHEKDKEVSQVSERGKQDRGKEHEKDGDRIEIDEDRGKQHEDFTDREMVMDQEDKASVEHKENGICGGKLTLFMLHLFAFLSIYLSR